ncbi:MAG TPA: hypothetical protein VIQ98_08645 [Gemmatimonadales bacterium]|jgi:hypothetical protein
MIHEAVTTLPAADVLARAKAFFAERVPNQAAWVELEGPTFMTLRGQGGEEIAFAILPGEPTRIRASTLLFDQALGRFLSTLPEPAVLA